MKASAIIVAAGSGRRLGSDRPKAFVELGGRPMLHYAMRAIASVSGLLEVVIALPAEMLREGRSLVSGAGIEIPVKLTAGGVERQDSVRIALELVSVESDVVAVHDAARPFAHPKLFEETIRVAHQAGAAIAAIPVSDTLKRTEGGSIVATDDAELVERMGLRVAIVDGSSLNFKITTRDDLAMAEAAIAAGMLRAG